MGAAVFVATGPLWLPEREGAGKYTMRYPMIGTPPALISVPTHFYKVILVEPADLEGKTDDEETSLGDSNCAVAAFVMPNRFIPEETPLTRFAVPISDLEVATGLTFFPKFMTERKRMQLDTAAHVWRSVGRSLQGKTKSPSLETLDGGSKEPSRLQNNILRIPRSELNSITRERPFQRQKRNRMFRKALFSGSTFVLSYRLHFTASRVLEKGEINFRTQ